MAIGKHPSPETGPATTAGPPFFEQKVIDTVDPRNPMTLCFAFEQSNSLDHRKYAADTLNSWSNFLSPFMLAKTGVVLLDLAQEEDIPKTDGLNYLDRSSQLLNQSLSLENNLLSESSLFARKHLAHLSVFEALINKSRPGRQQLDETYEQTMSYAYDLAQANKQIGSNPNRKSIRQDITGIEAELCIAALGSRFERIKLQDSSWIMIPSRYREDQVPGTGDKKQNWDISGLVAPEGDSYELAYKVQVKGGHGSPCNRTPNNSGYADDVTVINPCRDLTDSRHQPANGTKPKTTIKTRAASILLELQDEWSGTAKQFVTDRLDFRTEAMLDILG